MHAQASSAATTDWLQIVVLYEKLLAFGWSPVIALNQAVAIGMAFGAAHGLRALAPLAHEPSLHAYHPFFLARADLLRRAGRPAAARADYLRARDLCQNAVERNGILRRLGDADGA